MATLARVTPSDRLGFTLFLAVAAHALLILGVGFQLWPRDTAPPRLEITLAKYRDTEPPRKAQRLAQHNQKASGTLDRPARQTSPHQASLEDVNARPVLVPPPQQRRPPSPEPPVLTSTRSARTARAEQLIKAVEQRDLQDQVAILERSLEIASLEADYDEKTRTLAQKPRVRRLTSVATLAAADAEYLRYWQNRIERIGNRNYPAASRRHRIYGSLRLLVVLQPDGRVRQATVLDSSGHRVLDEAALAIIDKAQPFKPLPPELRREVDELEIIRTWHFRRNRLTSTRG